MTELYHEYWGKAEKITRHHLYKVNRILYKEKDVIKKHLSCAHHEHSKSHHHHYKNTKWRNNIFEKVHEPEAYVRRIYRLLKYQDNPFWQKKSMLPKIENLNSHIIEIP